MCSFEHGTSFSNSLPYTYIEVMCKYIYKPPENILHIITLVCVICIYKDNNHLTSEIISNNFQRTLVIVAFTYDLSDRCIFFILRYPLQTSQVSLSCNHSKEFL